MKRRECEETNFKSYTYLSNIIIILHVKSIEQKERETLERDYFSSFKININTYV